MFTDTNIHGDDFSIVDELVDTPIPVWVFAGDFSQSVTDHFYDLGGFFVSLGRESFEEITA